MLDPLGDGKSAISLIGVMGRDLDVVNDAKASYNNMSTELGDREKKLIRFLMLAEPPHMSPFRGVVFKFKVKAPLFIARQWWKHVVASAHVDEQLQWNELSLRYTKLDEPEFYKPAIFLGQDVVNKQKSSVPLGSFEQEWCSFRWDINALNSTEDYKYLLTQGCSKELARGLLIPAVYTTWHWTSSLQAVLNFLELREGKGAQSEITKYANAVEQLITPHVPEVMSAWREKLRRNKARADALELLSEIRESLPECISNFETSQSIHKLAVKIDKILDEVRK